ncbi:MAG: hypothetical protein IIA11_07230 [Proteobacteria bacterium]|nr:hypothetical protein [Pseudomonadota bacterium]
MKARLSPSKFALTSGTGIVLLVGVWCAPVLASSGLKLECREPAEELSVTALPAPPMPVDAADHGVSSAAAGEENCIEIPLPPTPTALPRLSPSVDTIRRIFGEDDGSIVVAPATINATVVTSPALADTKRTAETIDEEGRNSTDDSKVPRNDAEGQPAATPAESESDQPRFRRRMYRTDI